jgi:hypothetical protein
VTTDDRPSSPYYLTGVSTAEARSSERANLGLLITPLNSTNRDVEHFPVFAADNGDYSLGAKADPTPELEVAAALRWGTWVVDVVAPLRDKCRFVTIPDVLRWVTLEDGKRVPLGDAEATLERFHTYAEDVRDLGLPVALVLQDGLELDGLRGVRAGAHRVAWDELDAVFVGGSDGFKLGPVAEAICREARRRGKWSHVGRVNSWKRLALVRDYADSVDGTFLGFGPRANWPRLEGWLERLLPTTDVELELGA